MASSKILIIDDDEVTLKIVSATLQHRGFTVLNASSGAEGIKKANLESPDVILLDRMMPDMDGNAVLKELKDNEKTKTIPVVMLTGKSQMGDITESLTLGARDYIVKPFDHDNLLARIGNILK